MVCMAVKAFNCQKVGVLSHNVHVLPCCRTCWRCSSSNTPCGCCQSWRTRPRCVSIEAALEKVSDVSYSLFIHQDANSHAGLLSREAITWWLLCCATLMFMQRRL